MVIYINKAMILPIVQMGDWNWKNKRKNVAYFGSYCKICMYVCMQNHHAILCIVVTTMNNGNKESKLVIRI